MLFKDFVLNGFDMTCLWYVLQVPPSLATIYTPQVKIVVFSPSTGRSSTYVFEVGEGGRGGREGGKEDSVGGLAEVGLERSEGDFSNACCPF